MGSGWIPMEVKAFMSNLEQTILDTVSTRGIDSIKKMDAVVTMDCGSKMTVMVNSQLRDSDPATAANTMSTVVRYNEGFDEEEDLYTKLLKNMDSIQETFMNQAKYD